ncbi:MAG: hypothetical protein LBI27_07635, partial [Clostridiales bacterium]|nr:hypothetical protein [Clostridiales bacterium]
MSDDKNNSLTNDDYDDYNYDSYDDDGFDNYKYDDDFDDYSLTNDDEMPLTSESPKQETKEFERPLERIETKETRAGSRRETIKRVAEDRLNGTLRKPGVAPPDTRISAIRETRRDYSGSGKRRTSGGRRQSVTSSRRSPQGRAANKSKFAAVYIVLLMIAVGVCITVLMILLPSFSQAWADFSWGSSGVTETPEPSSPSIRVE